MNVVRCFSKIASKGLEFIKKLLDLKEFFLFVLLFSLLFYIIKFIL